MMHVRLNTNHYQTGQPGGTICTELLMNSHIDFRLETQSRQASSPAVLLHVNHGLDDSMLILILVCIYTLTVLQVHEEAKVIAVVVLCADFTVCAD